MAVKDNISNIEGLENNTILKTLQNVIKYVKENAVKGDKGDTGSVGPVGPEGREGKSIVDIQNITSSVVGENTINTIRVVYNTGETEDFTISCRNGVNGSEGPVGPVGSTGVGIASIENKGFTDGTDFTITHIEVTLTNGVVESFDVQAQRGATGPTGPAGEPADIRSVTLTGTTQGTITTEDLQLLANSNSNYIILNNEIYLLMDKQLASGYLVYSHIGQDSTNNYFVKCITITLNTQAWVMTSTQLGGGGGGGGASLKTETITGATNCYNRIVELNNAGKFVQGIKIKKTYTLYKKLWTLNTSGSFSELNSTITSDTYFATLSTIDNNAIFFTVNQSRNDDAPPMTLRLTSNGYVYFRGMEAYFGSSVASGTIGFISSNNTSENNTPFIIYYWE